MSEKSGTDARIPPWNLGNLSCVIDSVLLSEQETTYDLTLDGR